MRRLILFFALFLCVASNAQTLIPSQWEGKRVAFLGDSITDKRQIGKVSNIYWNNLVELLGIEPFVYARAGHRMNQIIGQAETLEAEHGQAVDAIFVFVGTNDFNKNIPVGEWYSYSTREVKIEHGVENRRYRELIYDDSTFKGRANTVVRWLKSHYPDKQIIFLTPIHRATYRVKDNYQPSDAIANTCGSFIDEYVDVIKELATVWAVPVIDLNSICGLNPMVEEHKPYFRSEKDLLHPNTIGHLRMAYALAYQLLGYPARFEKYLALNFEGVKDAASLKALRSMLKDLGICASFYNSSKSYKDDNQYESSALDSSSWTLHKPMNLRETAIKDAAKDGYVLCYEGFDCQSDSVETLKAELQTLLDNGFSFVTVSKLIEDIHVNTY